MLLITADRGLAGGYSANAIRAAESLGNLLRSEGKEVVSYIVGRKGISFYRFRSPAHRSGVERLLGEPDVPGCPDYPRRPHRAVPAAHE